MKKATIKILTTVLALLMLVSILPLQAFAATTYEPAQWPFKDVATDRWSFPYIKLLHDSNVIDGTSATTFEPQAYVSRAQFVKMLGCIAGIDTAEYSGSSFKDVKANAWYAPYVQWAVKTGVTVGTYPGMFQPNAHILRQDIAAMIYRYATISEITLPTDAKVRTFIDEKEISGYAKDAVVAMQQAQIINGEKNKDKTYSFHPKEKATREETATMLSILNDIKLEALKQKNSRKYDYTIVTNWIQANSNRNYFGATAYTETIVKEDNYQENYTVYHDKGLKSTVTMIEIYDGKWTFIYTYRFNNDKKNHNHYFKFTAATKGETYIECSGMGDASDIRNETVYIQQYSNDTNLSRSAIEDMIMDCRAAAIDFRQYILDYHICRS